MKKFFMRMMSKVDINSYLDVLNNYLQKRIDTEADLVRKIRRSKVKDLGIRILDIFTDKNDNNEQQVFDYIDTFSTLTGDEKERLKGIIDKLLK